MATNNSLNMTTNNLFKTVILRYQRRFLKDKAESKSIPAVYGSNVKFLVAGKLY